MARSTMQALRDRVRLMVNDPAGADQRLSDDDLDGVFDQHRAERWWVPLRPLPTFNPDSSIGYLTYAGPGNTGPWEDGYKLQRADYSIVNPNQVTSFDPWAGLWVLAADGGAPEGIRGITLRITGRTYDLYWTAADACRFLAGRLAEEFDFKSERLDFARSQQHAQLLRQAEAYQRQAMPAQASVITSDVPAEGTGGGLVYPSLPAGGYGGL